MYSISFDEYCLPLIRSVVNENSLEVVWVLVMDNHDIITAVQYGDFRAVREYIEHRIYSSNATDQDGCSLLHW